MKLSYGEYISPFPTRLSLDDKTVVNLSKPTIEDIQRLGFQVFEAYKTWLNISPKFYYTILCKDNGGVEYWDALDGSAKNTMTLFDVILEDQGMQNQFMLILNFFYEETVVFHQSYFAFIDPNHNPEIDLTENDICAIVSDSKTFKTVIDGCKAYCGMQDAVEEEKETKFKNKLAEEMFLRMKKNKEEIEKIEAKKNAKNFSIPNIISSVCTKHNSINYLNVGKLTVPQLMDTLNRLIACEKFEIEKTSVSVWGTGDNKKFSFTEWMENTYDTSDES